MQSIPFEELISNRLPSSYPDNVKDNIHLVSIDKKKSYPIGSLSYSYTLYPSDIDVMEIVEKKGDPEEIINYFESSIKNIVRRISQRQYYWILEVKCGIDNRFNFKLTDKNVVKRLKCLNEVGLLTDEEVDMLYNAIPTSNNITKKTEEANEFLRSKYILRWSVEEIMRGIKYLSGNQSITLNQALHAQSQINIEVIGLINNKFMDLSNFFMLIYIDENGEEKSINLPQEAIGDFYHFQADNLKKSMTKLFYSQVKPDYYKVFKRLWSLGKFTKDKQLIYKIKPFINSIYALAGQKRSELKTLMNLVKFTKLQGVPLKILKNQLSNIKLSVSSVVELGLEHIEAFNEDIDKIVHGNLNYEQIILLLKGLYDYLDEFVQENSYRYLEKVGLAPLPDYLTSF
jgi:hypothetical protein